MKRWITAMAAGVVVFAGLNNHRQEPGLAPLPSAEVAPIHLPPAEPVPEAAFDDRDLLTTAAEHEAGHVAALREFGIPVQSVSIGDDGDGETKYPIRPFSDPKRTAYDFAVVDVAGQEAAADWLVRHRGYSRDRALAEGEPGARLDLTNLHADAAEAGISEEQARERAREIITARHAQIEQLAERLMDRRVLNERELELN